MIAGSYQSHRRKIGRQAQYIKLAVVMHDRVSGQVTYPTLGGEVTNPVLSTNTRTRSILMSIVTMDPYG